jgi:hypothetical protein
MFECLVLYILLYVLYCVSVRTYVWKFVCLSVLSCIHCRTSYIVCQWEHMYESFIQDKTLKHTNFLTYVLTDTQYKTYDNVYRTRHSNIHTFIHMYESLYVWVSCPVYIVVRLILCVSDNICMKVCMFECLVLYTFLTYVLTDTL